MRTTSTLEPDVAQQLKRRMAEKKLTLKAAVNQALHIHPGRDAPDGIRQGPGGD